jgi:hypothetical protein
MRGKYSALHLVFSSWKSSAAFLPSGEERSRENLTFKILPLSGRFVVLDGMMECTKLFPLTGQIGRP